MSVTTTLDLADSKRTSRPLALHLAALGTAVLALAATAAFALTFERPRGAPAVVIPLPVRDQIGTMSTGARQDLIVVGETAQQRNALIPLAGDPLAHMAAASLVAPDSPQYASALKCMTQAIYYEAANEPELGKRAVAQVVINRLHHPAYPHSVCGVVYEGANAPVCQFSFICDGSLLRAPMPRQWAESRAVAVAALAGSVVPQVGSATNYHADYVLPRWAFTLGKIGQIGAHIFYRFPGSFGSAGVFTARWDGLERIPALDFNRLRLAAMEHAPAPAAAEPELAANLAVTPDVKDRHADDDVGGRLDPRTGWQLSIPDPVQLSASYRSAMAEQGVAVSVPAADANIDGQAKATK